jgi:BirA family biotin operon repressor/biotin-[acetyl-CoA-carboxylase] ligase
LYIREIVRLGETSSTNQVLVDRARAGSTDGLVVVADRQSAGRGRHQRRWVSPPGGSLLCSVLFRPEQLPVDQLYNLTSIVALAARRACIAFGGTDVTLKWPNDLITPAGKLAGVLAELVISTPPSVVVGIGCNLFWPPGWPPADDPSGIAELIAEATTLEASCGTKVARDEFLESFLDEVDSLYSSLLGPDGPTTIRLEYERSCSTIGQRVQVDTPTGRLVGVASRVNVDGSLEVVSDGQIHQISAADVVHLRPVAGQ